ncbi:MAG: hypothetical protein N2512_07020 [Armatimonadetes bacterium]|nr:hypothetical protein [Armatimonadota bacterium]
MHELEWSPEEEWHELRRRLWQRRRITAAWVAVLAAFLGLVAGLATSESFRCHVIYLEGPRRDVLAVVKNLLSDLGPVSTLWCPRGDLATRAKMCLAVEKVQVRRLSRHELQIIVVPREPAAAISAPNHPDAWMLADRTGMVYERVQRCPPGLVRLRAFPTPTLGVGSPLPAEANAVLADVLGGIQDGGAPFTTIDFAQPANVVGFLKDGTKVKIGALDNLRRKLALAGWTWAAARNKNLQPAYVDVRIPSRPTFLPRAGMRPSSPAVQEASPEHRGSLTPA